MPEFPVVMAYYMDFKQVFLGAVVFTNCRETTNPDGIRVEQDSVE